MAGEVTLRWFADRGFDLDLVADLEDIQLRFAALPVPADGTDELAKGVELNKIDILFKCQAAIDGAPAQLQDATIRVDNGKLYLEAGLEDVENGLLYPLEAELDCVMPRGAPASGGPRNVSPDEDDIDWGDETTFEVVAGDVPDAALLTEEAEMDDDDFDTPEPAADTGLAKLLAAMKNLDDAEDLEDESEEVDLPPDSIPNPAPNAPKPSAQGDQKMSAVDEAKFLLEMMVKRDELELEDDFEVDVLAEGAADILAGRMGYETMAQKLSAWLLEQDAVADLFIDDESLAQLLSEW